MHTLPVGDEGSSYVTISGTVEISDDPDGSFRDMIYNLYMGGATAPPEHGVARVIVRIEPKEVYRSPWAG